MIPGLQWIMSCFNVCLLGVEEERSKNRPINIILVYKLVTTLKLQQVLSVPLFLKGGCRFLSKMSEGETEGVPRL